MHKTKICEYHDYIICNFTLITQNANSIFEVCSGVAFTVYNPAVRLAVST